MNNEQGNGFQGEKTCQSSADISTLGNIKQKEYANQQCN